MIERTLVAVPFAAVMFWACGGRTGLGVLESLEADATVSDGAVDDSAPPLGTLLPCKIGCANALPADASDGISTCTGWLWCANSPGPIPEGSDCVDAGPYAISCAGSVTTGTGSCKCSFHGTVYRTVSLPWEDCCTFPQPPLVAAAAVSACGL